MLKEKKLSSTLASIVLWGYSLFTALVLLYMVYNSFRSKSDLLSNTFGKPRGLSLKTYGVMFKEQHFHMFFFNSVFILVASLAIIVLFSSMVAYALGRFKFRLNGTMQIYFLLGLMFPAQLGVLPVFLLMKSMHLLNSPWSVIWILSAGISMPVLLLTVFFAKMPSEIYESALLDGASEWKIFYRIMFPLASPVIFSICIIMSVQIWNQFFMPLIFLQSEEKKTVPLIVMKYTGNLMLSMDKALVASVLATVPILLLFIIFSEKILDGVASGAVKG
ncbi:carbohydrate ABC transporter permease [Paenibacillus psychroresistens]|uniref:Carbohydrate ABC transporter permease n=1 Tax=Paenibacillus psychroresistens TaxID=1778678 RepID=A0A6B8RTF4_9BACL|nr:carbohydrate ABC transporter permease [Paenibacillus psychroresistens]QGQ99780.1 carbohydrate ABC transporter permease [Paenibacillus psychroresistens]